MKRRRSALCLDKAYNSENEEQELIKRGYALHIPQKRKRRRRRDKEEKLQNPKDIHKPEKTFSQEMGCRADQLMAQQIQETVHPV